MAQAPRRDLGAKGPPPRDTVGRGPSGPDVGAAQRAHGHVCAWHARDRLEPRLAAHERHRGTHDAAEVVLNISSLPQSPGHQVDIVMTPSSAYYVDILHAKSAEIMAASS